MRSMRGSGRLVVRFALAGLCAALTSLAVHAQSVVRVTDADGVPIAYAIVRVSGGQDRVVDSLGRVRYTAQLGASPSLLVRRLGYTSFRAR